MKLFYFKSHIGNFGDDLNPWLWEKIFGDFKKYKNNKTFVGIGSILDVRLNSKYDKIIFGAGVRELNPSLNLNKCDIRFVRGPLSSKALLGAPFITDSAYCLRLLDDDDKTKLTKIYKRSIIPYFRHLKLFNWKIVEFFTGIHFIDVTKPIDQVLKEIKQSDKIICGAMHGAIVADAYRVPWGRFKLGKHGYESIETSELKWSDWLLSMEINHKIEYLNIKTIKFSTKWNVLNRGILKFIKIIKYLELILKIRMFKQYQLSDNAVLNSKLEQLSIEVEKFKSDYK